MHGPERAVCRVMRDGRAVGLAFVVTDRALLTSAHVVNAALGRPATDASVPEDDVRLLVEFPFGGERDDEPVGYATVGMWGPSSGSFTRHDVAGLALRGDLPTGVEPLRLAESAGPGGTTVHMWGPGRRQAVERWGALVEGQIRGEVVPGVYQVDQRLSGFIRARPGFSGGPVWRQDDHHVLGVLSAAAMTDGDTDAYVVGVEVAVACWPRVLYRPPPCPYRGLGAFGPDDAAVFFGREPVVASLLDDADRLPVLAVMGPSGVGKSSVVAAGLVAALRQRGRLAEAVVRPGRGVVTAIATALAAQTSSSAVVSPENLERWEHQLTTGGLAKALGVLRRSLGAERAVLVLDQFEQILSDDHPVEQRAGILALLADLITDTDAHDLVVLTLRSDFLGQLIALDRRFGPYLQANATMLYPPTEAELSSAIVEPARCADPRHPVAVEPALVAQMIADFSGQAGELPLVQFALTQLWRQQTGPVLTLNAYAGLGGARQALTDFADRCMNRLTEAERAGARRVFCRLGLTDSFQLGRRIFRREIPTEDWSVVQRLAGADARLVVVGWDTGTGDEYVEIAHEVLLRAWPRLRQWLEADREFLTWLQRITAAHLTWQEHGEDRQLLLPEPVLRHARGMVADRPSEMEHLRSFIKRSEDAVDQDELTGLPNRRRMRRALEESLKARSPDQVVAVLDIDIRRLEDINQSLGQPAGDQVIAVVAGRLRGLAPPAAHVGRVAGDEFAVVVRLPDMQAAYNLAVELQRGVQEPISVASLVLNVNVAIGIAIHPDHGSDPDALFQRSTAALNAAKLRASAVHLFTPQSEARAVRRLGLAADLREALDNGQLDVYFQPKVSLRSRELAGAECFARWHHPVHGPIDPVDFIPAAELSGQLTRLTEVVLRTALHRAHEWPRSAQPLHIAVNVTPKVLAEAAFPSRVLSLLHEFGVDPGRLTLELTETQLAGDAQAALAKLNELGVRLSVDDFGTGYLSLGYLRRLPIREIKIDGTFVRGMATDPSDLAIVRSVVDLSRNLGLTVVAEGVESELTLDLLEDIGCDVGQGYLFGRPFPFDRLLAFDGRWTLQVS